MKTTTHINRSLLMVFIVISLFAGFGQITGMIWPGLVDAGTDDNRYGILGQPAPELDLTGWIDGEGRPMDPIRLKDLKGKVVYLYFFQNW